MPNARVATWANVLIHREHPLMQLIAYPNDPVQCVWYDDVVEVLASESKGTLTKHKVTRDLSAALNCKTSEVFPWLPRITNKYVLPFARRSVRDPERYAAGHRTEAIRAFPVFLLPFLRIFAKPENVSSFDTYVLTVSQKLRDVAERTKAPPAQRTYGQFLANMTFAKNTDIDLTTKNFAALNQSLKRSVTETKHSTAATEQRTAETERRLEVVEAELKKMRRLEARVVELERMAGASPVQDQPREKKRRKESSPSGAQQSDTKRARTE
jgi:hypothetical protein